MRAFWLRAFWLGRGRDDPGGVDAASAVASFTSTGWPAAPVQFRQGLNGRPVH